MAGQTTGLQKTYILEDPSVEQYTAVTYGSNVGGCVAPSADNAIPLGVITNDERVSNAPSAGGSQLGRNVAVQLSGIAKVRLSGNVSYGERVILANGGAVKRLPQNPEEGNGSFNILGIAEASGTDGKVIPVNIRIGHYYVP